MKKIITSIFVFLVSISYAQITYDFEIIQDTDNQHLFTVNAIPSADVTGANFTAATVILLVEAGETVGNITSLIGTGWDNAGTITAAQLQSVGLGDGTKDFIPLTSSGVDNYIFNHTTGETIPMVSFEVTSMPTTGSLEVLMNDDPIMVGLNALSLNVANAILINPQDGSGGDDHFGALSGNTVFNFSPVLNVNDEEFANFSFYPNPTRDILTIKNASEEIESIKIYNVLGKQIIETKPINDTVNLSNYTTGVYILKLYTQNAVKSIRVIKQ